MRDDHHRRRPSELVRSVALAAMLILVARASFAQEVELTCPASATAGTNVAVTVDFVNDSCSAAEVRIITSIVGNANDTLGGLGIYGPSVAEPMVAVPAGSGVAFCGCGQFTPSFCSCSGIPCTEDADCPRCTAETPSTLSMSVDVEPALPSALAGTVGTVIVVSEIVTGSEEDSQIAECFVEAL